MKWLPVRLCATALGVAFLMPPAVAEDGAQNVQAFLPLFEKNSLGDKVLDVRFSSLGEAGAGTLSVKVDLHLVFDAATGKYREEQTYYFDKPPNDADVSDFIVHMWDGKEFVEWKREVLDVFDVPGYRVLVQGKYEDPGSAEIWDRPRDPYFVSFCFARIHTNVLHRPLAKTVPEHNPKLGILDGDVITIETSSKYELNKFEFSKETGILKRFTNYYPDKNNEMVIRGTWEFSEHVERSGFWIPLRIVAIGRQPDGSVSSKVVITADPKTLRLLDTVEEATIFHEALPAGCWMDDHIKNTKYKVTVDGGK